MRVSGRSFQKTFFVLAMVGLSNWSFWLSDSLRAAPARTITRQGFAEHQPQKSSVLFPFSSSNADAKLSVVTSSKSTTNMSGSHLVSVGGAPPSPPSAELNVPNPAAKKAEQVEKAKALASTALGTLTPAFIENRGQFDEHVKFQIRANGKTVWLTDKGLVFDFVREKTDGSIRLPRPSDSSGSSQVPQGLLSPQKTNAPHDVERLVFNEEFLNANSGPNVEATGLQHGTYNFISGDDPANWETHVQAYAEAVYRDVWEGIDVRFLRSGSNLEQEFFVHPGAAPKSVEIGYRGIEGLAVAKDGSLEITTAFGKLQETKPRIYQEIEGERIPVDGRFKLTSEASYTFELGPYKSEYAVIIDPTLLYSTYLGGSAGNVVDGAIREVATGIAVDAAGNAYVTGYTESNDFPTTSGSFQSPNPNPSARQTFVTKLDPTGATLVYSTYLNAPFPVAISVDRSGNAYVAGWNASSGFSTTPNAYSQSCLGSGFLSVLNPSGTSLFYSTCFGAPGGPSSGLSGPLVTAMTTSANGQAFIAGSTNNPSFPTTPNAYQTSYANMTQMAFVTVFDTNMSGAASLVYSTLLGVPPALNFPTGSGTGFVAPYTAGTGISVDSFGKVYLTGTAPLGFPTTPGAFQTTHADCIHNGILCTVSGNSFIAKLDPSALGPQSLIYSTYLGGIGSTNTFAIAVDSSGSAYVTGQATGGSLPTTPGAFQTALSGGSGNFVTKLDAGGSKLIYSTYLSDSRASAGNAIAVDSLGNAYVAGQVNGSTFPVTPDAFQGTYLKPICGTDCANAFLAKLNATGSALLYSSYLGGTDGDDVATAVAVDQTGDAYVTGHASSSTFPTTPTVFQQVMHGTGDAFVTKFPTGESFRALDISPKSGGNTGFVTIKVYGGGFHTGISLTLRGGGQAVVASPVTIEVTGRILSATFDLHGAVPGPRDLVVANTGETTIVLSQAFSVDGGGSPDLTVDLIVPRRIIDALFTDFYATISNKGTVDAVGVPFWLGGIPSAWDLDIVSELSPLPELPGKPKVDLSGLPTVIDTQALPGKIVPLFLSSVPAGGSVTVRFRARPNLHAAPAFLAAWVSPPYFHSPLDPHVDDCLKSLLSVSFQRLVGSIPFEGCALTMARIIAQLLTTSLNNPRPGAVFSLPQFYNLALLFGIDCAGLVVPEVELVKEIIRMFSLIAQLTTIAVNCLDVFSKTAVAQLVVTPVSSLDPNELEGSVGVGSLRYISGSQTLTYATFFDNAQTAGAAARSILVTSQLDRNLDLNTLQLGSILIDGREIPLSSSFNPRVGLLDAAGVIDLRPNRNLVQSVRVSLDVKTGILTWLFNSIDTTTGQPPTDPNLGLLPPDSLGSVFYLIKPTSGLSTNSTITAQSTIVFDANPPMSTQEWTNTIDNNAPVSHVAPLPSTESSSGFIVNWSGADVGAGIQDFTIYVSDNGGPFTAFQTNTPATSSTFMGQSGHVYSFFSITRDLVGNVEPVKTSTEAKTGVVLTTDTTPPFTIATASPPPDANGWNNTDVLITLNSRDGESGGTGLRQVSFSMTGAQNIASTVVMGATAALPLIAEGATTITFFGTDNVGNVEVPSTITVRIDKITPIIIGSRTPPSNANGWTNSNVTVGFTCADSLSGLAAGSPPPLSVLSGEGAGQLITGACQDLAGNSAGAKVSGINIDKTAPILTASANPPPSANGWNNSPTTVSFAAVDTLSGVALVSAPVTVAIDGKGQIVNGNATDLAGNITSGNVTINLDQAPPEAFIQFDPTRRDLVLMGRDSLSGVSPGLVTPVSVQLTSRKDGDDHNSNSGNENERRGDARRVEIRTYKVFDLAGNSLVLVAEARKNEESEAIRLLTAQYAGGAVVVLPRNEETFEWNIDRDGTLRKLTQTFTEADGKDSRRLNAEYDPHRGTTTIERELPKPEQRSVQQGLVFLRMTTVGGKLSIGF